MPFAEQWKKWFSNCARDAGMAPRLTIPREPSGRPMYSLLTGYDEQILSCIAELWVLYARGDEIARRAVIVSVRALLPALSEKCHPFARDLIARSLDWSDRDQLWSALHDRSNANPPPANGNRPRP